MGKVELIRKKNGNLIKNLTNKPENLVAGLMVTVNKHPEMFFTIEAKEEKKGSYLLTANTNGYVKISEIYVNAVSEQTFFNLLDNIIDIICFCIDNNINTENMELNDNGVYIDSMNNSVKIVYWPIINNTMKYNLKPFFDNLVSRVRILSSASTGKIEECKSYLSTVDNGFSVKVFRKFISSLFVGFNNEEKIQKISTAKDGIYYNPLEAIKKTDELNLNAKRIFCPNCNTPNNENAKFCLKCGTRLVSNEDDNELNNKMLIPYILLFGKKTPIKKRIFIIGKCKEICDLLIEKSVVSRQHAIIERFNNDYYIIDNNSTNGTFLNNERLKPNEKAKLNSLDIIKLANIKITFIIE